MLPRHTLRKVTEFGIICTAVATLILAGCGGGGASSSSATPSANPTSGTPIGTCTTTFGTTTTINTGIGTLTASGTGQTIFGAATFLPASAVAGSHLCVNSYSWSELPASGTTISRQITFIPPQEVAGASAASGVLNVMYSNAGAAYLYGTLVGNGTLSSMGISQSGKTYSFANTTVPGLILTNGSLVLNGALTTP